MRDWQSERRWRQFASSPFLLLGLALIAGLFTVQVWRFYQKERLIIEERRPLLEEVERLKKRQAELAAEVEKLATERGTEEMIRENFNVVKPGEKVISLLPSATVTPSAPPLPWWQQILNWFKTRDWFSGRTRASQA